MATIALSDQDKKAPTPVEKGRVLFVNKCSVCHGANAMGDDGPNLHGLKLNDKDLTDIITTGFKGEMPSFKGKLKAEEIKQLIGYLRTLKKKA